MFIIEIDGIEAITERIDDMYEDVARLHQKVPDQFMEWQAEDMNRKHPTIEEAGEGSSDPAQHGLRTWTTRIWPRSRLSDRRRSEQKRRRSSGRKIVRQGVAVPGTSTRPILRPELFEMLRERMRALLDSVTWKKD